MADVANSTSADSAAKARPEKPDEANFKAAVEQAEKEHKAAQAKFETAKKKVDDVRSGRSGSGNDRWKELVDQQKDIRTKQQTNKSSRAGQQEKYNKNEAEIKALIAQQKDSRARAGFKNVEELDAKIDSIMKQVDSGQMKLVDEKKALAEVTALRRQKKGFSGLDDLQKKIDEKKAENAELKKTFDSAESRALAQTYEDNQKELDEIKAAREGNNKNFETLKAEREKLYAEQQTKFQAIRKIKDDYYTQRKAYKEFEDQIYQQRRERQKSERDAFEKDKRRKIAEAKLEEASEPAFLDEIRTAEGLLRHFDPTYGAAEGDKGPGEFAASAQRTVDESAFKGRKVTKKDDEDFFVGTGGKKKGKGKKGTAAAEPSKFNMNIGVIEELGKVGVEPPSNQADVPSVVEKLKEKVDHWKKEQKSQTEKNIEKAKKEIERLEKEAAETPSDSTASKGRRTDRGKKATLNNAGSDAQAEEEQEKDATADVTEDLKDASIEDKQTPEVATG